MHQLTYISTAIPVMTTAMVDETLRTSRRNNARDGITGLLIYDGKCFLQALEGDRSLVEATFERIRADPRHRASVMLSLRETPAPEFGGWDMACEKVETIDGSTSLIDTVDALVAHVPDANTHALFSGFAKVRARTA